MNPLQYKKVSNRDVLLILTRHRELIAGQHEVPHLMQTLYNHGSRRTPDGEQQAYNLQGRV